MQFVNLAKELAVRYHAGQRYGEHEYIYHLDNVAQLLEQSYDDRLLVIAYLHDIPKGYTYDSNGNELTYKDSDGYWSEYTRDSFGNLLTYKNSKGANKVYSD